MRLLMQNDITELTLVVNDILKGHESSKIIDFAFLRFSLKPNLKMSQSRYLSNEERTKMVCYREIGMPLQQIASKMNRSYYTVQKFLKDPENHGKKPRSGRPPLLQERDKRRIRSIAVKENHSAAQICQELALPISKRRVQQILRADLNVSYEKKLVKCQLLARHKVARIEFAQNHKFWDLEWQNIIFSGEKKFNLDGPDGYQYYYRDVRAPKQVQISRNFQGGSLMVWAAFGFAGKSPICFVTPKMNSEKYVQILDEVLVDFGEAHYGDSWIFQQDNAAIHVSKYSKTYFEDRKIPLLKWPAKSRDLNPIENLWGILSAKVYMHGRQFTTERELKEAIVKEWAALDVSLLQKLILSMPGRITKVLNGKGDHI